MPSEPEPWGYRVEGHHLSQNYTVVNGKVTDGPSFFGANPAEVRQGPRKGLRTLAAEDDLGFELINRSMTPQQKIAVVDPTAYKDILTAASRKAALQGPALGLFGIQMNAKQFDALQALLGTSMRATCREVLAERRTGPDQQSRQRNFYFAWSGGIDRGDPHYYRVHAPSFLIELDDTQDDANHIHSVWRDFNGDFGADLLKHHYDSHH